MSFTILFTLFFVCGTIVFASLITVIYFLMKKKKNKRLYIIPMILFVIFTLLAFYLVIGYLLSAPTATIDIACL